MSIKLLRKDGQTITANEDRVAFDYAFHGQFGVIKNYGEELSHDVGTLNIFRVQTGMAVVQGGQVTIEATESVSLQPASGTTIYWYILYFEIDYANKTAVLKTQQYTNQYPAFPISDNLASNPFGKVYLPLFRFKQSNSGVSNVERACRILGVAEVDTLPQSDDSYNIANTAYVRQAIKDVKNIIEGSISISAGITALENTVRRQVNFVYGTLRLSNSTSAGLIGYLPVDFRPKAGISINTFINSGFSIAQLGGTFFAVNLGITMIINTEGQCYIFMSPYATYESRYNTGDMIFNYSYEITGG